MSVLCFFSVLLFGASLSSTNELPEFRAGSTGNEILISLDFEEQLPSNSSLTLNLREQPEVAANVKILEREDLSGASQRVFAVYFDLGPDVPAETIETIALVPFSDQLLSYEASALQFSFRIVEEVAADDSADSGWPTLKLAEIHGPVSQESGSGYVKFDPRYAGFETYRVRTQRGVATRTRTSIGFTDLPIEIQLGQPFSATAEIRMQVEQEPDTCLASSSFNDAWGNVNLQLQSSIRDWTEFKASHRIENDIPCSDDKKSSRHAGYKVGGTLVLGITCSVIDGGERKAGQSKRFKYRCRGESVNGAKTSKPELGVSASGDLDFTLSELTLIYKAEAGAPGFAAHIHPFQVVNEIPQPGSEESTPDQLYIVIRTEANGYHRGHLDYAFFVKGATTSVRRIPRGVDPKQYGKEIFARLGERACIEGSAISWDNGMPEQIAWRRVTILKVGPFRSAEELQLAEAAGQFKLGAEWTRSGDATMPVKDLACN